MNATAHKMEARLVLREATLFAGSAAEIEVATGRLQMLLKSGSNSRLRSRLAKRLLTETRGLHKAL
jgi:hypothetical protein